MRLLKRILMLLLGLVVIAIGVAFFMPSQSHGERSIVIERSPQMVFGLLNGFRRFNDWSPWAGLDPNAVYTRSGPDTGVGATFAWKGNAEVGEGSQTIKTSEPHKRIQTALDFGPMGTSLATFTVTPVDKGTQVTWALDAELPLNFDSKFGWNLMGRWMGPWMGGWVEQDFERGLASLKKLLESIPEADISALHADIGEVQAMPTYYISTNAALDAQSSTDAVMTAITEISIFATVNGLQQAGPPRAEIIGHDDKQWQFEVALPYDRNDVPVSGQLKTGSTHQGKVILFKHLGGYDTLGDTHAKAHTWLAINGYREIGRRSEIYVSDPIQSAESERLTIIQVPVEP